MLRPLRSPRGRAVAFAVAALLAGGVATGCDLQEDADLERGRALFVAQCGTCHALAEAGTAATVGPDLDASFATARADGMDQDTIEGVVQSQIENPRTIREGSPNYDKVFMPANLVEGRDGEDVAAYVASVAGVPGLEPPKAPGGPGGQVFATAGCQACHTFEAAEAFGTAGPNLDETLEGQEAKQVMQSIVDPDAELAPGFSAGLMPTDYGDTISESDLKLLVEFLLGSVPRPKAG